MSQQHEVELPVSMRGAAFLREQRGYEDGVVGQLHASATARQLQDQGEEFLDQSIAGNTYRFWLSFAAYVGSICAIVYFMWKVCIKGNEKDFQHERERRRKELKDIRADERVYEHERFANVDHYTRRPYRKNEDQLLVRQKAEELNELRAMDRVNAMEEARLDLEYERAHEGKPRPQGWRAAAPKLAP